MVTKTAALAERLNELHHVVVAFSGGADSAFLAAVAACASWVSIAPTP